MFGCLFYLFFLYFIPHNWKTLNFLPQYIDQKDITSDCGNGKQKLILSPVPVKCPVL